MIRGRGKHGTNDMVVSNKTQLTIQATPTIDLQAMTTEVSSLGSIDLKIDQAYHVFASVDWSVHRADMQTVMALPYSFLKIMKINSTFGKYGSPLKVLDFVVRQKTQSFRFFMSVAEAFCTGTYRSHFLMRYACAKDRNMQICSRKCHVRARKTRSRQSISEVSQREHRICKAAS